MSMEISREIEARLVDEARKEGISVNALLERMLSERDPAARAATNLAFELPLWHLGSSRSLHRRDIYDGERAS